MIVQIILEQVVILSFEMDYWPVIGNQKIPTILLEFYVLCYVSLCTWAKRPLSISFQSGICIGKLGTECLLIFVVQGNI